MVPNKEMIEIVNRFQKDYELAFRRSLHPYEVRYLWESLYAFAKAYKALKDSEASSLRDAS